MTSPRFFVTTSIPYVNAPPHLGHGLEFVQADVLARHARLRGREVRFQSGTDDHALKNVLAAEDQGVPVAELVGRNASRFEQLRALLDLSFDDFIRTSSDPRHGAGAARLWKACEGVGDLYKRFYEGLYCVGCEQFYRDNDLFEGRCPEHGTVPEWVAEENWFFRLSRYQDRLLQLLETGQLRIAPEARAKEAIAFVSGGLEDFSISRTQARARGWGVPVPGDDAQVMYVWWDALGNYITALGYGTGTDEYRRWWVEGGERVHVIGKGILRFHAVYWPAMLLSAGIPLPTSLFVHDYLTAAGQKLSKSLGNVIDPVTVVERFGCDALRWWFIRDVPRIGDTDFTAERLISRYNHDLAHGFGNLINRTVSMIHRYRGGDVPAAGATGALARLRALATAAGPAVDDALAGFDLRAAADVLWACVDEGNRAIERIEPWHLYRRRQAGDPGAAALLDSVLAGLAQACVAIAEELQAFLPGAAARTLLQLSPTAGRLPPPRPLFPRIDAP